MAGIVRSPVSGPDQRSRQQHILELHPTCAGHGNSSENYAPCSSAPVRPLCCVLAGVCLRRVKRAEEAGTASAAQLWIVGQLWRRSTWRHRSSSWTVAPAAAA